MGNEIKVKTYVISLPGSDKRRASIKKQMGRFGIEYEIVDAVRGSELDIKNDKRIDQQAVEKASNWLTPGTIGCALSHMECYRRAKQEDLDYVIIFEDDAKILNDYKGYLGKIFSNIRDKQVVLLYYTAFRPVCLDARSKVPLAGETVLYNVKEGFPIAATAYILCRKAYLSMMEGIMPIRVAADSWEYFIDAKMLSGVACVYPNPIDTMDFKSEIDYLRPGLKQKISSLVDRYQLFPFYQILMGMRRRNKLKMKQTKIV